MTKRKHRKTTTATYKREPIPKKLRFEILNRDDFTCRYCGQSAPDVVLHADHIKPVAKGGTNDPSNLVAACSACNGGKSDKLLNDMLIQDVNPLSDPRWEAIKSSIVERDGCKCRRCGSDSDISIATSMDINEPWMLSKNQVTMLCNKCRLMINNNLQLLKEEAFRSIIHNESDVVSFICHASEIAHAIGSDTEYFNHAKEMLSSICSMAEVIAMENNAEVE